MELDQLKLPELKFLTFLAMVIKFPEGSVGVALNEPV